MEYNVRSKHGIEQTIKEYYAECVTACDEAEKAYDADKRSGKKREIYQYCFAQVEAMVGLMEKLEIDYEEDDEE